MRKSGSVVIDEGIHKPGAPRPSEADLSKAHEAAPPTSAAVQAGLENFFRIEQERDHLRHVLREANTAHHLMKIENEDLRSRLAAAESRVAELQIRSDEAVRKEAGLKATLEAVIRTALFGADPSQTIEHLRKKLDESAKLNS